LPGTAEVSMLISLQETAACVELFSLPVSIYVCLAPWELSSHYYPCSPKLFNFSVPWCTKSG